MPKVILKSNYIKGGCGAHGKNLVSYIGTRDGVEKHIQKYIDYISNRDGVEKFSNHGLFTSGNSKIVLSDVQKEVAHHKGNIWLPIISLTREDAIKTGFDNGTAWKNMLSKIAPKIADYYKIKIDNLCWYASYHDEGHHPHVHMLIYSKNPHEGFLTSKGIEKFKSLIVKEVFALEMEQIYVQQSMERDKLKQQCQDIFADLKNCNIENYDNLQQQIFELKLCLANHKGKKSYGYLKKSDKEKIDKIVDSLEEIPAVKQAYGLWHETRFAILGSYSAIWPEKLPLSKQKEFLSIKNMIIKAVDSMEIDLAANYTVNNNLHSKKPPHILQIANSIIGILNASEKIFTDEIMRDASQINNRTDKKALAKLIEKKSAHGQKHTNEDLGMSMK